MYIQISQWSSVLAQRETIAELLLTFLIEKVFYVEKKAFDILNIPLLLRMKKIFIFY